MFAFLAPLSYPVAMAVGKWKNPYLDLVLTKPDTLLPCVGQEPSSEEIARLRLKMSHYSSLLCELCSGSGAHLVELARRNPHALCIGFETRYKRAYRTAEKAVKAGLGNLIVLRCNAKLLLNLFPSETLDGIYTNFPDPWEKRRWEKHRLLTEAFLAALVDRLKPNGFFSYKTDHPRCFKETAAALKRLAGITVSRETENLAHSPYADESIPTEFEIFFRARGLQILHIEIRKDRLSSLSGV